MNHRLVIQNVSFNISAAGSTLSYAGAYLFLTKGPYYLSFAGGFDRVVQANQSVLAYLDGPNAVNFVIVAHGNNPDTFSGSATITGYLLDCSTTPCNPIAGQ
jgi:hypothetical protein